MTFEEVVPYLGVLLNLIVGVIGVVPLTNFFRELLNIKAVRLVQLMTVTIATTVATLTLVVEGAITEASFAPDQFFALLIAVLTASQAEYARQKRNGTI